MNKIIKISLFVFHRNDSKWLPAGKSYGVGRARPGSEYAKKGFPSWRNMEEVRDTVQSAREFQFDSLQKEFFNRLKYGISPPE